MHRAIVASAAGTIAPMKIRRGWLIAGVVVLLLLAAALTAHQMALQQLRIRVLDYLGPRASVDHISIGLRSVELRGLRIVAPPGWPAEDEMRARSVHIVPDLPSWFGVRGRVQRVSIEGGYLSVLRQRQGGVKLLPSLFGEPRQRTASDAARVVHLNHVRFDDGLVEFYDASVRTAKPHRLRIEALEGDVEDLKLPALDEPLQLDLKGRLDGPHNDGPITLQGQVTPASRDAVLHLRLRGADLVALQPYVLTFTEGGVRRGTMDLTLDANVQHRQLRAPGTVVVRGLELSDGGSMLGVPRAAVLASLKKGDRIELSFTLEGRIDDPKFSLNESFAREFTAGVAKALGVTIGGVAEGIGAVIKGIFGR